jgi:lysophospholipase L1-like esterase
MNFKKEKDMKKKITLVGFGDSITQAIVELKEEDRWLTMLQKSLQGKFADIDIAVVNSGVGGNTSREGLARIEKEVIAYQPDFVLIEFGGNDATYEEHRHVTLKEFEANLAEMVQILTRKTPAHGVLMTFTPIINEWHGYGSHEFYKPLGLDGYIEQYRSLTRTFAAQHNLPLIDIDQAMRTAMAKERPEKFILKDGAHLTPSGCRILADTIFPVLCDMICKL